MVTYGDSPHDDRAEKLHALVLMCMANTRMKDFYCLWSLAQRYEFDANQVANSIAATFGRRRIAVSAVLSRPTCATGARAAVRIPRSRMCCASRSLAATCGTRSCAASPRSASSEPARVWVRTSKLNGGLGWDRVSNAIARAAAFSRCRSRRSSAPARSRRRSCRSSGHKPRYLMGVGLPEDLIAAIARDRADRQVP